MSLNQFELAEAYTTLSVHGHTKFTGIINNVRGSLVQVQAQFDRVGRAARRMLLVAGGSIGGLVKLASDAEEISSKFDAVFKDQSESVRAWAKEWGTAIGRNRYALEGFLASFQDTFVPMGFARAEAAKLSKQLTQLTVDLSSFNNTAESETQALLGSALVGNHEAVRRFGIIITEATLGQELLNMGITGGAKAAGNQEKVMARLNLIMKMTSDAQGDAARTAGSMANQFKALKAKAAELAVELGQAFLPAMRNVVSQLGKGVEWIAKMTTGEKDAIATWGIFTTTALGVAAALPLVIGGLKVLAVVAAGVSLPVTLVASLAAGIVVLGGVWATAKIKGESFGETVAKMTEQITGQGNAVTELADAMERQLKIQKEWDQRFLENMAAEMDASASKIERGPRDAGLGEMAGRLWGASIGVGPQGAALGRKLWDHDTSAEAARGNRLDAKLARLKASGIREAEIGEGTTAVINFFKNLPQRLAATDIGKAATRTGQQAAGMFETGKKDALGYMLRRMFAPSETGLPFGIRPGGKTAKATADRESTPAASIGIAQLQTHYQQLANNQTQKQIEEAKKTNGKLDEVNDHLGQIAGKPAVAWGE